MAGYIAVSFLKKYRKLCKNPQLRSKQHVFVCVLMGMKATDQCSVVYYLWLGQRSPLPLEIFYSITHSTTSTPPGPLSGYSCLIPRPLPTEPGNEAKDIVQYANFCSFVPIPEGRGGP